MVSSPTVPGPAARPIQRAEPLREIVYARIVDLIWSGHYDPGAALTEASLSKQLDVSRTPVREALLRLEAEGVLRSTLARGFTVRQLTESEAAELYPILWTLEALAVRTAEKIGVPTAWRFRKQLEEMSRVSDPIRRWRMDTQWHQDLVALGGNAELSAMVTRLRTNLSRYELTYMRNVGPRPENSHQHRDVIDALAAADAEKAAALLIAHWQEGMKTVLEFLRTSESPAFPAKE